MRTILCVGETQQERDAGTSGEVVTAQIEASLQEFPKDKSRTLAVAYEPVWAIGTGRTPSIENISEMRQTIAEALSGMFGSSEVPVLYGGSVSSLNAHAMCVESGMDGALVGGASLHADEVSRIIQILNT